MIIKRYRFRIYPTKLQRELMDKHFGCCRFVFNHFLARRIDLYKQTGKGSTYNQDCAELTKLKKDKEWLGEVHIHSLQQSLRHLDAAYKKFFKEKKGFPKFKSKKNPTRSFSVPQSKIRNGKLVIGKFSEGIKIRLGSRPIPITKSCTITKDASGKYFASICVHEPYSPLPAIEKEIGIDVGISSLVTTSDGEKIQSVKSYKILENRLARLQRGLSRKKKGSKNRDKAKIRVARLNERIANIRKDQLHKVTHKLTSENQAIYVEDLNIVGMKKNRSLAKSLNDVSIGELIRQLKYKCDWRGRHFVKIDRWFPSSKTCSCCQMIKEDLQLQDRNWKCEGCGTNHDRDLNAAMNILLEGRRTARHAGVVCGESIRPASAGNSH